jgi:hypothetical protein
MDTGYILKDIDKVSSHFVVIGFSLPFCVHLSDDNYRVLAKWNGSEYKSQIVLSNRYRRESKGGILPGVTNTEKFADRRGSYRFSLVKVYIPIDKDIIEKHPDANGIWNNVERNREEYQNKAVAAINRFITVYRYISKECHVRQLAGHDVWFDYSFALICVTNPSDSSFMPVSDIHDVVPAIPNLPSSIQKAIRKLALSTTEVEVPLAEELLLNAYDYLDQGNYRSAVIDAETAFEAAVYKFLRDFYKNDADTLIWLSDTKQGFSNLINSRKFKNAIATKAKSFGKEDSERANWDENVWQLRGALVHGRKEHVDFAEASVALDVVEKTLAYLFDRQETNPWQYSM